MSKNTLKSISSDLINHSNVQEEVDHDDTYNDDESMSREDRQIDVSLKGDTINDGLIALSKVRFEKANGDPVPE